MKPRLGDAFCGAGGSSRGYIDAGWDVIGFDSNLEVGAKFPGEFVYADALEAILERDDVDAWHVGPPCQGYSTTRTLHPNVYPRWIGVARVLLETTGKPYVIENVEGARSAMRNPIQLCGSSFGLGVRRHRLFETNWPVGFVPECAHYLQPEPIDVTGTGGRRLGPRLDGKGGNSRKPLNLAHAREVMGIDWMTRTELAEAIPPAYTAWLGERLLDHMARAAA